MTKLKRGAIHLAIASAFRHAGFGVRDASTAVLTIADVTGVESLVAVAAGRCRVGGGVGGGSSVVEVVPLRNRLGAARGQQGTDLVAVAVGVVFVSAVAAATTAGLARATEVELRGDFRSEVAEEMGHGEKAPAEDAQSNLGRTVCERLSGVLPRGVEVLTSIALPGTDNRFYHCSVQP